MIRDKQIEIYTDGAMDYDTKQTGGTGFVIKFPMSVEEADITGSFRRDNQGVHRLEMIAILEAMRSLKRWLKINSAHTRNISGVTIHTDRMSVTDQELLNPWKVAGWRKRGWKNHEGKSIKDKGLIDDIDKERKRLCNEIHGKVEILWLRRKHNKEADKLSKAGKTGAAKNKVIVADKFSKVAQRLFDGDEINYAFLSAGDILEVRVYKKDAVQKDFEVLAEISDGDHFGQRIRIYISFVEETFLHRHHYYRVTVKEVGKRHIKIRPDFEEINPDE